MRDHHHDSGTTLLSAVLAVLLTVAVGLIVYVALEPDEPQIQGQTMAQMPTMLAHHADFVGTVK